MEHQRSQIPLGNGDYEAVSYDVSGVANRKRAGTGSTPEGRAKLERHRRQHQRREHDPAQHARTYRFAPK